MGTPLVLRIQQLTTTRGLGLQVTIRGTAFRLLLDTGAAVSILKSYVLKNIDKQQKGMEPADNLTLTSASGHTIPLLGVTQVDFRIHKFQFKHKFVIIDTPELIPHADGILGLDFLRTFAFRWELRRDWLLFNKHRIPLSPIDYSSTVQLVTPSTQTEEADYDGENQMVQEARKLILSIKAETKQITLELTKADITPEELLEQAPYAYYATNDGTRKPIQEYFKTQHLDNETRNKILQLLDEYQDIFVLPGNKLKTTPLLEHHINTGDAEPVFKRPYPVPHALREELRIQIDKMLEDGIITPSTSAWSSPVLLVKKKGGTPDKPLYRPVIDYRGLNAVTKKDRMPVLQTSEHL